MKTLFHRYQYLPWLVVGIAVILFSTAGIAAIRGWYPASSGDSSNSIALHDSAEVSTKAVVQTAETAQKRAKARANGRCAECGLVVSMGEANGRDDDFGIGAADGVKDGDQDERPVNLMTRYEIIVRMTDGSHRVIKQASPASWRVGERVIVIAGSIPPHR